MNGQHAFHSRPARWIFTDLPISDDSKVRRAELVEEGGREAHGS
ncbi:MAG: hypothetical protein WDN24_03305 [Sphingomonas sp.]